MTPGTINSPATFLQAAGCPSIRFHDLRHTNASLRLENGENIKYIQNQLGHASPTITLNGLCPPYETHQSGSGLPVENAVFGENGSKMVAGKEKGLRSATVTPLNLW